MVADRSRIDVCEICLRNLHAELESLLTNSLATPQADQGYPVDAKRFKKDIATMQKKIGISDEDIWRIR